MVSSREPEDFLPKKAGTASENILDRVVEYVSECEDPGHVGGRNDDGIGGFGGVRVGSVIAALCPLAIEPVFDLSGVVRGSEFRHKEAQCLPWVQVKSLEGVVLVGLTGSSFCCCRGGRGPCGEELPPVSFIDGVDGLVVLNLIRGPDALDLVI